MGVAGTDNEFSFTHLQFHQNYPFRGDRVFLEPSKRLASGGAYRVHKCHVLVSVSSAATETRNTGLINESAASKPCLDDVSLKVLPKEKVVICGRTGRYALCTTCSSN